MTTKRKKRVAIYARVSTDRQTTANQIQELQQVATRAGWQITGEYIDTGISGVKGRDKRPEFDRLCRDAVRRQFDVVMAWSVDRLGRSTKQLIDFFEEIRTIGVDLYLHQQGMDTSTPSGRAMLEMCGVFASFERAMIQERVKAGLQRARASGKTLGRPRVAPETEETIRKARAEGIGILRIAKEAGCGVGTVQRVIKEST